MQEFKKVTCLAFLLCAFAAAAFSQKQSLIHEILKESVESKVDKAQDLIGFDDHKALLLKELELRFLLDVNKAEHCVLCHKSKRIAKLSQKREEKLQEILTREQYIKYDIWENERIKNVPLHL